MFDWILMIGDWNPALAVAVFLVIPAMCWWLFQTAYQGRWIADREGIRWSRVFLSFRTTSAFCLSVGSLIVSVVATSYLADFVMANEDSLIPLIVIVALAVAGFCAIGWVVSLGNNAVHQRYPEEYDPSWHTSWNPPSSRPYNPSVALRNVMALCIALPILLTPIFLVIAGIVAILGVTVGSVITVPVYVVAAVLLCIWIFVGVMLQGQL